MRSSRTYLRLLEMRFRARGRWCSSSPSPSLTQEREIYMMMNMMIREWKKGGLWWIWKEEIDKFTSLVERREPRGKARENRGMGGVLPCIGTEPHLFYFSPPPSPRSSVSCCARARSMATNFPYLWLTAHWSVRLCAQVCPPLHPTLAKIHNSCNFF